MKMHSDSARKRRVLYQRSLTLPDDYVTKTETGDDSEQDESMRLLLDKDRRGSKGSVESCNGSDVELGLKQSTKYRARSNSGNGLANLDNTPSSVQVPRKARLHQLVRRNTVICGEPLIEHVDSSHQDFNSMISRSISTPSVILNKVKEKIRRHVVQTTEWPPPSELVRDHLYKRRNSLPSNKNYIWKSSDERCEKLSQEGDTDSRSNRLQVQRNNTRRRSPPCQDVRSLSESQIANRRVTKDGGIVCSRNDIRAIMKVHQHEVKKQKRTPKIARAISVECPPTKRPPTLRKQVSFEAKKTRIDEDMTDDETLSTEKETSVEENLYPEVQVGEPATLPTQPATSGTYMGSKSTLKSFQTKTDKAYYDIRSSMEEPDEPYPSHLIKEIEFDEHGQTWDVYGADFDAEILGDAIQRHLKTIMGCALPGPISTVTSIELDSISAKTKTTRLGKSNSKDTIELRRNGDSTASKFFQRLFCLFSRKDG